MFRYSIVVLGFLTTVFNSVATAATSKSDLVAAVAEKANTTEADAEVVIDALLDAIVESLARGERVEISGFGVFEVRSRSARVGRNPRTGERESLPARRYPDFKAGKAMKEAVSQPPEVEEMAAETAAPD